MPLASNQHFSKPLRHAPATQQPGSSWVDKSGSQLTRMHDTKQQQQHCIGGSSSELAA
jgi:hypothetical protein